MKKLTVVISQSQSRDPRKRALEEQVLVLLADRPELAVSVVPPMPFTVTATLSGSVSLPGSGCVRAAFSV